MSCNCTDTSWASNQTATAINGCTVGLALFCFFELFIIFKRIAFLPIFLFFLLVFNLGNGINNLLLYSFDADSDSYATVMFLTYQCWFFGNLMCRYNIIIRAKISFNIYETHKLFYWSTFVLGFMSTIQATIVNILTICVGVCILSSYDLQISGGVDFLFYTIVNLVTVIHIFYTMYENSHNLKQVNQSYFYKQGFILVLNVVICIVASALFFFVRFHKLKILELFFQLWSLHFWFIIMKIFDFILYPVEEEHLRVQMHQAWINSSNF